ncbi:ATP-binding protein [bacterium]|nr:ATP-binding protein [bacterium]
MFITQFSIDCNVSLQYVDSIPNLVSLLHDSDFSTVMIIFKDEIDAHYVGEVLDKFNEYTYIPRLIVSSSQCELLDLFYIRLPIQIESFADIFHSAIKEFSYYRNLSAISSVNHSIVAKQSGKFRIQTFSQARDLARALSHLCPDANRVAMGLTEILVNSIEHGNLGLSFEDKTALQKEDAFLLEIDHLLSLEENKGKYVDVRFEKFSNCVKFHVIDMGDGFDWEKYMQLDETRIHSSHGRGIAMANMLAFTEINYIYPGNQVELVVCTNPKD